MEFSPSAGVGSAEMLEQPYTGVGVSTTNGVAIKATGVGETSVWLAHALRVNMLPMDSNKIIKVRFIY